MEAYMPFESGLPLYRVRTLPAETRAYVPKIIAAIIIGRNPEQFGFVS